MTNNSDNNNKIIMNFILNRSKGEHNGTPLHKTMFYSTNEFNLACWGTIEIWPQKQALVGAADD